MGYLGTIGRERIHPHRRGETSVRVSLRIGGMTCLDCSRRVARALERIEGVSSAAVDYRAGRATVEVNREVPPEALISAVERAGYHAELSSEPAPNGALTGGSADSRDAAPVAATSAAPREHEPGTPILAREALERPSHPVAPERGGRPNGPSSGAADFDLLIIGTGGAGMAAAIQGAELGANVAIVEGGTIGGTCVNVGCIPSKNLIEAAAHYYGARRGFPGIAPCEGALAWREVLAQKQALIEELRRTKYVDVLASYPSVTLFEGRARLLGDGRVQVGNREHRARKVVVATGTSPAAPPIPGLAEVNALDSTTAMELEELPRSMIVLGGSAVGLELGQMFARFSVKVTVIELMPHLLPSEDESISEALKRSLEEEGLEIHTGTTATSVERDHEGVVVRVRQGDLVGQLRAERLLVAVGRRPNTRDLGLEAAGVELTERGFVRVDAAMRTSNPDVFAAGDVTGGPGYVYVAAAGGRVAAANALQELWTAAGSSGELRELDLSAVPRVTFTAPQVASVGLTEAEARAAGHDVQASTLPLEQVPRALVAHQRRGLIKLVIEAGSGKLLGVHAVGPNAGELMGEATLAVRAGLTARDLTETLHPYLTWVEGLKLAAQATSMDVSRLSCCA
jgi:mercuric reductase